MASGFSGGYPDIFNSIGGDVSNVARRSTSMTNVNNVIGSNYNRRVNYRSPLEGIIQESLFPVAGTRSDLIGKRSLVEFQQQQQSSVYSRNVKPRAYIQLSDFLVSSEVSSVSSFSSSSPVCRQLRPERFNTSSGNFAVVMSNDQIMKYNGRKLPPAKHEMDRKMLNRLRELEKELLLDDEEEQNEAVSVVTGTSQLSETKLLNPVHANKPVNIISPSPTTSSSSSCASSSATISPKRLIIDAAEAITDGKSEIAVELIARLNHKSSAQGTPEQRLGFYIAHGLQLRLRNEQHSIGKDDVLSTQLLYDKSPCFKLPFIAANNIILQTLSDIVQPERNIHVVDFDIGHGIQYAYLIHEIAAARKVDRATPISLKLTTFKDFGNGGADERLNHVCDRLISLSNKLGILFRYNVLDFKLSEISKPGLEIGGDEVLAVNLAFKLNKLPDESVTTENFRDEVLRRVKGLYPAVVTLAEQDLNTNTSSFTVRVNEVFGYYTSLVDSFDATISRENPERVKMEEGVSRRIMNSVACEGRERVERCEVFGKWRARMRMAGFDQKPVSQATVDYLLLKLNSGSRGNPGFTVKEDSGGVSFGWLGRTLTILSAWR